MADTIITTPAAPAENSGSGWVIAVILLIALIGAGAYAWTHYGPRPAAPAGDSTNINVTIPAGSGGQGDGSVGGDTGGGSAGGSAGGTGY